MTVDEIKYALDNRSSISLEDLTPEMLREAEGKLHDFDYMELQTKLGRFVKSR